MSNQYVWLYNHLDGYIYNSSEAKMLYKQFKALELPQDGQFSSEIASRVEELYDRFVQLFEHNPLLYQNGLCECEIETTELENYFIEGQGKFYPIGYYKEQRPVESVILIKKQIEKHTSQVVAVKDETVEMLESQSQIINDTYISRKDKKKANYFRAVCAAVGCLVAIWYTLRYFFSVDIIHIIFSINSAKSFSTAIYEGMTKLGMLAAMPIPGFFLLTILHILLAVFIGINAKDTVMEFILTYQKKITAKFKKQADFGVDKVKKEFSDGLDEERDVLWEITRQGSSVSINRNELAPIMKQLRKNLNTAQKYTQRNENMLRGVAQNKTICGLLAVALLCVSFYELLPIANESGYIKDKIYAAEMYMDTAMLRGKTEARVIVQKCPVYSKPNDVSKHLGDLKEGFVVEILKQNQDEWTKLKFITEDAVVEGWVRSNDIEELKKVDVSEETNVKVADCDASSSLVGSLRTYVPELALDGDMATSWQTESTRRKGKNETLKIYFEEKTPVNTICIFPGNGASEDKFVENSHIKKAKITFSDGESIKVEFDDDYNKAEKRIKLNKTIETESIEIKITGVYGGLVNNELCVSEVAVFNIEQ